MAIFQRALNPFGKAFGDMSESGRNNAYANSIMFNAVGNKLREGRKLAARNNLSYGGVDDQGEHIFAPAGVYQPIQEAAEGIAGLLDSRPLPPDAGLIPEGPRIFPPTHGDPLPPEMLPAPIDPINNMYQEPITDDPYQYAQPDTRPPSVQVRDPMTEIPGPGRDGPIRFPKPGPGQIERIPDDQLTPEQFASLYGPAKYDYRNYIGAERIPDDQLTAEQLWALYGDRPAISPTPGGDNTKDQIFIEEGPVVVSEPIGQPMDTTTTTDTGTNPFYAGATNVAQPPSMTPVAPSFGLDVGVGSYGTTANTAGFSHPNIGGFGGFNLPSTPTAPEPTPTTATGVAPQTTTTPLPTVNSFAGFNGFGGFGGF